MLLLLSTGIHLGALPKFKRMLQGSLMIDVSLNVLSRVGAFKGIC